MCYIDSIPSRFEKEGDIFRDGFMVVDDEDMHMYEDRDSVRDIKREYMFYRLRRDKYLDISLFQKGTL